MTQALEVKGYAERKKLGLCVRDRCEEKPEKNTAGERRSYCNTHAAINKRHAEAWAARQGKPKAKKAKVVQKVKVAEAKTVGRVAVPGIGIIDLVERALTPPVAVTADAITELMEKRGCSRKIAAQYLRRQAAKGGN